MSELFKNKYRIKSIRLEHWDYSSNGAYFVTICTKNRINYLGEIINEKMKLSGIGVIVNNYWNEIPIHYKNISLDTFVIMPNHVHGIIVIDHRTSVETCHGKSLPIKNAFAQPIRGSISMIINQYKSTVKRWCNKNNHPNFQWQSRFYESIIRNEKQLNNVRNYIINNPKNWKRDRNNL